MNFTLDRIFSEMLRCAAEKAKLESCSSQDKAAEKQPISMAELNDEKQISKKRKLERAIETVKIRKLNVSCNVFVQKFILIFSCRLWLHLAMRNQMEIL